MATITLSAIVGTGSGTLASAANVPMSPSTGNCTATALNTMKEAAAKAVANRQSTLTTLLSHSKSSPYLSDSHRSMLAATIMADQDGVVDTGATLQSATACAALKAPAQLLIGYRIYTVLTPQVALVTAGDAGDSTATALANTEKALNGAIKVMPAGDAKTQATSLATDYASQISVASSDFSGVSNAALAVSTSDYPQSSEVFASQAKLVANGVKALSAAETDAEQLTALLG
jgi:hypothetical protein